MRRWLAGKFRRWADRLDRHGAPKRTHFGFTVEDGWGLVMNDTSHGCPLWYYGDDDYQLAFAVQPQVPFSPEEIQWVTVGGRAPDGSVHVLGSAEVRDGTTTRRMVGHDKVEVPMRTHRLGPARPGIARVPQWEITLTCKLRSFVSLPARCYQDGIIKMFGRPGIHG